VVFFLLEDSARTFKDRLSDMAPEGPPPDLWIHYPAFHLAAENYSATLRACQGATLLIIDPLIQAAEVKDWNSQQEVRDTFELWRRLARESDTCAMLLYHHRKQPGDFGDQMAGSVQAQAAVDGIVEMYRDRKLDSKERRMSFIGREWPDLPDEVVSLNIPVKTWERVGSFAEAKEQAAVAKSAEDEERLFLMLPGDPPGIDYETLVLSTGFGRRKLQGLIRGLGDRIGQARDGQRQGGPMLFWRVAE
jgi:hypothetical protein